MSKKAEIQFLDHGSSAIKESNIIVGNNFAFLKPEFFKSSGLDWLNRVFNKNETRKTKVLHLFQREGTEIGGLKLSSTLPDELSLQSITSDKSLYKAGQDTVDLLVLDLSSAGSERHIVIQQNGNLYLQRSVELGKQGEAKLSLNDLPAGDYEVFFEGCNRKNSYCRFTAAEYKLVPLVAELLERELESDNLLHLQVKLSSFGIDVTGKVSVELYDEQNTCLSRQEAPADRGRLKVDLKLEGQGSHMVNFQLVEEPGKTASLPIVGSRKEERSKTMMNPLGSETFASLLPSAGSTELRGLYLSEGAITNSPLKLEIDNDGKAALIASHAIETLVLVAIDPHYPRAREGAVVPSKQNNPDQKDNLYKAAVSLFQRGQYKEAALSFAEARQGQQNSVPHPYYAYYQACCQAKMGNSEAALIFLRQSIADGWNEFEHMSEDEDLASLKALDEFKYLVSDPYMETELEDIKAGQRIELAGNYPLNLYCIACVIDQRPWEGWTSFLSPCKLKCQIKNEADYKCGQNAELKLELSGASAADCRVFALVKDARLLSLEKPEARLAAAMKEYLQNSTDGWQTGFAAKSLAELSNEYLSEAELAFSSFSGVWGGTGQMTGAAGQARDFFSEGSSPAAQPTDSWGASPTAMPMRAPAPQQAPTGQNLRMKNLASKEVDTLFNRVGRSDAAVDELRASIQGQLAQSPAEETKSIHAINKGQEPQVLFADFLPLSNGSATLVLPLPLAEADYIVEVFALAKNLDWASGETRFRAVSDPLCEFTLPCFVSTGQWASAFLHVSSISQELTCSLYHNDKEVQLQKDSQPFGTKSIISERIVNLEFTAEPGVYKAQLKSKDGKLAAEIKQRVDEPGKLVRTVRSLRLLKSGDSFKLSDEPGCKSIKVIRGLEENFQLLTEATSSYAHCCCEQTAAKVVSACSMYMFAGGDAKIQEKSEAMIIAGLKRQKSMWLPGRGFKTYPEYPNQPDTGYCGPTAARHLASLSLLEQNRLRGDLSKWLNEGKKICEDTLIAYRISFAPERFTSMQEVYQCLRFSSNGKRENAISYLQERTADPKRFLAQISKHPCWGLAVHSRIEAAYAAAALIAAGGGQGRLAAALELANHVVKAFNADKRLYSTADSIAAIALLSEMLKAKIVGGAGKLEINGKEASTKEAIEFAGDIESVRCLEGVLAMEVEKDLEEDWQAFSSSLPLKVSLEKEGQAQRNFKPGQQLELKVKIEEGYKTGDLLWVCLPDCLSRVWGGAQIKLFSMDFSGRDELSIPLAVTGRTNAPSGKSARQNLAICVRNMYDEERGGNPGLISISAEP